ncbi:MAG: hypothetical protein U0232_26390 [Thermomicrobiales bacterium]
MGQDATRIEYIWQYLFRGAFFPEWQYSEFSRVGDRYRALGHQCASAGGAALPAARQRRYRDRVPTYCHIGGHALEGVVESAQAAVADGWRFVRWGIPEQGSG